MTNTEAALILLEPFGLSLIVLLLFWRPWRRGLEALAPGALPLVLALAYPVGRRAVSKIPSFPPPTADEWLVFAAMALGAWGLLEALLPNIPRLLRLIGRFVLLATLFYLMGAAHLAPLTLVGLVVGVFVTITLVDLISRGRPAPVILWTLTIAAAAASPILLLGASFRLSLMAATLSTIAAAAAIITTSYKPNRPLHLGPFIFPFCALLAGLFLSGVRFAMTPLPSAISFAAILVLPLIIPLGSPKATLPTLLQAFGRITLTILLCAAALGYTYYETRLREPPQRERPQPTDNGDEGEDDERHAPSWRDQDPYTW